MRLELFPLGSTAPPMATSCFSTRRPTKSAAPARRRSRRGRKKPRLRCAHTEDGGGRRRVPELSTTSPAACPHSAWLPRGPGSGLGGAAGIRRRLPGIETRGRRRPPRRTEPSRGRERGRVAWFLPHRALRGAGLQLPSPPRIFDLLLEDLKILRSDGSCSPPPPGWGSRLWKGRGLSCVVNGRENYGLAWRSKWGGGEVVAERRTPPIWGEGGRRRNGLAPL